MIGTATPDRVSTLGQAVRDQALGHPIGLHLHNTRDTALANVLAAPMIGGTDLTQPSEALAVVPSPPAQAATPLPRTSLISWKTWEFIPASIFLHSKQISAEAAIFVGHDHTAALPKYDPRIGFTYAADNNLVQTEQ